MNSKKIFEVAIKEYPSLTHTHNEYLVVAFQDGKIYFFNRDFHELSITISSYLTCAISLPDQRLLLGKNDGNALILELSEYVKQSQINLELKNPLLYLGLFNDATVVAFTQNNELVLMSIHNQFDIKRKFQLQINLSAHLVDKYNIVLGSQNILASFCTSDLNELETLSFQQLEDYSKQQLVLEGESQSDPFWKCIIQIQGSVRLIAKISYNLFFTTDKGKFYHCYLQENKIDIQKVFQLYNSMPIQLQLVGGQQIHFSFKGSQLYLYDQKLRVIEKILQINDSVELIASHLTNRDNTLYIISIYQAKNNNQKILNAKFKIIKRNN